MNEREISDEEFLGSSRGSPIEGSVQREALTRRRKEIEERTLESSSRSLGLLFESEKVGLATAEELHRQKEQLKSTEKRLDDINATLTASERHLQGVKSVFGGIMNYFSGRGTRPLPGKPYQESLPHLPSDPPSFEATPPPLNHPALAGKYFEKSSQHEDVFNKNLDEMSEGLSRLKDIARGLNKEMDEHNNIIDRIDEGVSKNSWRIEKQNKEMNKILKK